MARQRWPALKGWIGTRYSRDPAQRYGDPNHGKTLEMDTRKKKELAVIGWREWVGLPDLGIIFIKAKVDSGARSSSLHAFDLKPFERDGEEWVRFKIHPVQRRKLGIVETEAKVFDRRSVRSSSGKASMRPVILTNVSLMGITWSVEMTLANRDDMGFRMLLGRQAFRHRFLVDAGKSYCSVKPPRNTPSS